MAEQNPVRILASRAAAPVIVQELTRRRFLSLAAIAGGTAFLAACAGPSSKPTPVATGGDVEDALSIYSWGDYDAPEVLTSFTDEFGAKITVDSFGSNEELISKLVAAKGTGGYDIIVPTGVFIPQMIENGLLLKLNKELIPNLEHMDAAYLGREWDPENEYSICKAWGTTGFVYDKTVITRELTSWADFLDAAQNEASGKTSVLDDPAEITGMYYWANGIDWNTTDTAEIDACEDFVVNTLAPHIAAFDSYPGSGAIPQGTHALIEVWNGDARQGILNSSDPDKWQWVLGSPTTELWMDNWAISASAPHPEAAHAFINYVLTPENAIAELDYIGYHTGAKDIQSTAEEEGLERLDLVFFTPEQLATMKDGEVNEAQQRTVDIWNKAKAAAGA
ncbi:polyamine ABC transporter substrate-binding protein [Microbacterium terricola]|uniref:ABC transporter substrate-binding protein n=1 Tax=Microbacterium terricola TaxID=344163 RepID=A0ABM8E1K0_9MICO|nr:spermidine/putrescine ABC transporter substrate-binding protein [Microbacterium terricola]UYK40446.1 spermidine/putrescine ABC transporter substrate-binding protein [Microbacterium terricola]BDV31834.1 ABC transporter substrate-binding protein [Microbacterium terricola]